MILGKKVVLRAIEEGDLEYLQKWHNNPALSELVVGWSFPVSMQEQRDWYLNSLNNPNTKRFIVESKNEGVIGLTGLWDIDWQNRHALTALKIGEENLRRRGYGTDAIMAIMSYAFYEVGLNKLWSLILPYNKASYNVYVKKCGWKVEGNLRKHIYRGGKFYDLLYVSALKEDFEKWDPAKEYLPPVFLGKKKEYVDVANKEKVNF